MGTAPGLCLPINPCLPTLSCTGSCDHSSHRHLMPKQSHSLWSSGAKPRISIREVALRWIVPGVASTACQPLFPVMLPQHLSALGILAHGGSLAEKGLSLPIPTILCMWLLFESFLLTAAPFQAIKHKYSLEDLGPRDSRSFWTLQP